MLIAIGHDAWPCVATGVQASTAPGSPVAPVPPGKPVAPVPPGSPVAPVPPGNPVAPVPPGNPVAPVPAGSDATSAGRATEDPPTVAGSTLCDAPAHAEKINAANAAGNNRLKCKQRLPRARFRFLPSPYSSLTPRPLAVRYTPVFGKSSVCAYRRSGDFVRSSRRSLCYWRRARAIAESPVPRP